MRFIEKNFQELIRVLEVLVHRRSLEGNSKGFETNAVGRQVVEVAEVT